MTTRKGYLVALAVFVAGAALAGLFMWRLVAHIDGLARVEMPGEQTVELPAGELIMFAESMPGDVEDRSVSARCGAVDAAGAALTLATPGSSTTYSIGSRRGRSMFTIDVPSAGAVTIRCESSDSFVLAIGEGVGLKIVLAVISMFAGGIGALVIAIRTWRRRRRERKAAAP